MKIQVILRVLPFLLAIALLAGCQHSPQTDAQWQVYRYAQEHDIDYNRYPSEIIDLLERNPETEAFVLEYPTAKDQEYTVDLYANLTKPAVLKNKELMAWLTESVSSGYASSATWSSAI